MQYREAKPSLRLVGVVDRYWSVEYDETDHAPSEPILPDGCPEIVFNLADRFQRIPTYGDIETQASTIVSGQIRKRIVIRPTGRVSLFGIRFQPHGGFGFLGVRMSSITDQIIPLETVIGSLANDLESRIVEAASFEERIDVCEHGVKTSLSDHEASVAAALTGIIRDSGGRMLIRELVGNTGVGERRMERMFDKYVGVSPKFFARLVRFGLAVRNLEVTDDFGLLDKALSFGYYDQSHMIHEFNEFAGMSPTEYFAEKHRLSEWFTS